MYCSRACMREVWKTHRPICEKLHAVCEVAMIMSVYEMRLRLSEDEYSCAMGGSPYVMSAHEPIRCAAPPTSSSGPSSSGVNVPKREVSVTCTH
eukprot:5672059-Pyramimonas_sp.AAC.1